MISQKRVSNAQVVVIMIVHLAWQINLIFKKKYK